MQTQNLEGAELTKGSNINLSLGYGKTAILATQVRKNWTTI